MFSRDRDFIRDSSDRVFFGSLDRGESCRGWLLGAGAGPGAGAGGGGGAAYSGLMSFMRSSWRLEPVRWAELRLAECRDTFFFTLATWPSTAPVHTYQSVSDIKLETKIREDFTIKDHTIGSSPC